MKKTSLCVLTLLLLACFLTGCNRTSGDNSTSEPFINPYLNETSSENVSQTASPESSLTGSSGTGTPTTSKNASKAAGTGSTTSLSSSEEQDYKKQMDEMLEYLLDEND